MASRRRQSIGTCAEDAAHEFVGELRRCDVEHSGDESVFDEPFHRAASRAGRVKHQDFVTGRLEAFARRRDAGRRDSEHRGCDDGFCDHSGARLEAMPTTAQAALWRMRTEIRLRPAMSTTEYIIVMSLVSTNGETSPEARVDTMTLGTPTGSARIAVVPIVVLADPPAASTPAM